MTHLTPAQQRYRDYLQSPHWRQTRARIIARADDHCEWCHRFCGQNPHWPDEQFCGEEDCEFCEVYFDDEHRRNDRELQRLEVHHTTYARLGRELDTDLVALCWNCHDEVTDRAITLRSMYRAGLISKADSTPDVAATRYWPVFWAAVARQFKR